MLSSALLLLTLTGDGDIRLTLSPAQSAAACEDRREVLTQVLAGAGQAVIEARCGETGLRMSPFIHGVPPEAEIYRYRVEIQPAGGFAIAPLSADEPCVNQPDHGPAFYCTRSAQRIIETKELAP